MTSNFRDLLERYKNHAATPEETAQVEAELEKFEAINDYLCEKLEDPDNAGASLKGEDVNASVTREFTGMVKRSIRRAFLRMGLCILSVTLAAMLFVQFGLSPLLNRFYYNPTAPVGQFENQMSLDMAVYTDLRYPLGKRDNVNAIPLGYGRYSLTIPATFYHSGMERPATVAAELNRNRLTLFDAGILHPVPVNLFAAYGGYHDTPEGTSWVTTREYARELLEKLGENEYYTAYLSFERDITFEEYKAFEQESCIPYSWFPVRTSQSDYFGRGHMGLSSTFSGTCIEGWDEQRYPWLLLCGNDLDAGFDRLMEAERDEGIMTTHLLSQLSYLSQPEQKTFLSFFDEESETFSAAYEYVSEHGLSIYGCVFYGEKEQLLKIADMENVYGIYVVR